MFILFRNPNRWMDLDEIRHKGGPRGGRFLVGFRTRTPDPAGTGPQMGVRVASGASAFLTSICTTQACATSLNETV